MSVVAPFIALHVSKLLMNADLLNRITLNLQAIPYEYLEPYSYGLNCSSYASCQSCLTDSLCAWCSALDSCMSRMDQSVTCESNGTNGFMYSSSNASECSSCVDRIGCDVCLQVWFISWLRHDAWCPYCELGAFVSLFCALVQKETNDCVTQLLTQLRICRFLVYWREFCFYGNFYIGTNVARRTCFRTRRASGWRHRRVVRVATATAVPYRTRHSVPYRVNSKTVIAMYWDNSSRFVCVCMQKM